MNRFPIKWKPLLMIIGIVVIVVLVVVLIVMEFGNGNNGPQSAQNGASASSTANASTTSASGATTGAAAQPSGAGSKNVPVLPGPSITIDLLTPISGNVWTIGQANPIAWDNPAKVTGEIDLLNATTKAFVGVILSETGPNQTSYSWDARSIYRARYSADKTDVIPGTYAIRIKFDGNGLGDLVSGPITITN